MGIKRAPSTVSPNLTAMAATTNIKSEGTAHHPHQQTLLPLPPRQPLANNPLMKQEEDDMWNVAKIAVGKGIKHSFNGYLKPSIESPNCNSVNNNSNNSSTVHPSSNITLVTQGQVQRTAMGTADPLSLAQSVVGKGVKHQQQFQQQQHPAAMNTISNNNGMNQVHSQVSPQIAIANSAVGKGVKHSFSTTTSSAQPSTVATLANTSIGAPAINNPLLVKNEKDSTTSTTTNTSGFTFLDPPQLGMLPFLNDAFPSSTTNATNTMTSNSNTPLATTISTSSLDELQKNFNNTIQ